MWKRIREIVFKEFRQTLREPRMRILLFVPPLVQLLVFGYAVNLDVDHVRIAWFDRDQTSQSRDLLAAFQGSPRFDLVAVPSSDKDVQRLLDESRVHAVISVFPGFGRDIERGVTTSVEVLVDGSNSNTASIASAYANQVISGYGASVLTAQQQAKLVGRTEATGGPVGLGLPSLDVRSRVWFNPDLLSRNYFVPGVVVNIVTLVSMMLTAMAIVREKEIGTLEQLMVTPVRPIELMIGKTLPFGLAGLVQVAFITTAALVVFHIPLRGSVPLLFCAAVVYLMTTLGVGLFVSTISQTQQQAVMGSFFFFTPAFMLSGFAFPIRNMPLPVQLLSYLDPVRYFMTIVRGIFLKGTGFSVLWPQFAALFLYGTFVLTASALRFHKRLD
ncbi:MAG TPA: ABC transporter permease [Bryobacteraceae bacterium]|nr:ABC transporter permease [Bryobacteraceae bacterium]